MTSTLESDRALRRAGGFAALLLAACYLAITALYVVAGAVPPDEDGAAWLAYFADKTLVWTLIVFLSVLTDMLFLPVVALVRELRRSPPLILGAGFLVLFVVLDLAVTWPNYAALIRMSSLPDQASPAAAATYASSVLGSGLFALYAIGVPALGIALISVELRGLTRYAGVVTGVVGVAAVIGVGVLVIIVSVLTIAWVALVGVWLLRLRD
ncbi:hypothetical protein [Lentzea sp. NPDC051838]|uniref:hypothetical protein n=1 Tax=Lentzea sp. NPDC051838 TaxID=3154849 RepID=UPI003420EB1B